jgi:hypothetical protein
MKIWSIFRKACPAKAGVEADFPSENAITLE